MKTVYLVQHENIEDDYIEEKRFIGIFSTEESAKEAIEEAKKFSGFEDCPNGFEVTEYVLDKSNWFFGFKF